MKAFINCYSFFVTLLIIPTQFVEWKLIILVYDPRFIIYLFSKVQCEDLSPKRMLKKVSSTLPNHSTNNLNIKKSSKNSIKINKLITRLILKNNTKSHITKSNTKNINKKSNTKKRDKSINTNKKSQEDKDKIDLNLTGTRNKLLFKLKYQRHLKMCSQNLMEKSLRMNLAVLRNKKKTFSCKRKNWLINKNLSSKVVETAKKLDSAPFLNMVLNWESKPI